MTNLQSTIELTVMRRVRLIRILALVISTTMLAVLTTVAALWGIGREVWVARVFENMPAASNAGGLIGFWVAAFLHTQLLIQILAVLTLVSLLFLVRETARLISSYLSVVFGK